ncbi:MAG: hypothetical protein HQ574_03530 [Chloroflexi bacterium]|nr:hypothetical protein [Chloroflexota bacterium]
MSDQKPKKSGKQSPASQSSTDRSPDQSKMNPEINPTMERMETFPKTNTFPKKWDLSDLYKGQDEKTNNSL